MKRNILLLITLTFLASCDPLFTDRFFISNSCKEKIDVNVTLYNDSIEAFEIVPGSEYLFYIDEWVGGVSEIEKIDFLFKNVTITKGDSVSQKNYANHSYWKKINVESSHRLRYYTEVKYYLYIKP